MVRQGETLVELMSSPCGSVEQQRILETDEAPMHKRHDDSKRDEHTQMDSIKRLWRVTSAIPSPNVRGSKKIYLAVIPQQDVLIVVEAYTLMAVEDTNVGEQRMGAAILNGNRGKAAS